MQPTFDVAVVGLGAHGSSALYHLSRTGQKVLGIDRFAPPHNRGSSHGQSRIIRKAYHESPMYVPLVKEAYALWEDLERVSGKQLLLRTSGIVLGAENAGVVKGAKLSASLHNIPHEVLDYTDIKKRFPALKPTPETIAVLDKDAGILLPEICIQTHLEEAQKLGASLHVNEQVLRIAPYGSFVEITTDKNTYQAANVIVGAGAWLNSLMPELNLPLTIERQALYWFKNKNKGPHFTPGALPVFIWEHAPGDVFYGFPDLGDGIKTAFYHGGKIISPDTLAQDVAEIEVRSMEEVLEAHFDIDAEFNYATACMYTNTPDEDFIIDFHPAHKNVIIASPCSGHGFKFASLVGKILCDMAMDKAVLFDLWPFRINRFAG